MLETAGQLDGASSARTPVRRAMSDLQGGGRRFEPCSAHRPRDTYRGAVVLSVVVEWKLDLQRRPAAVRALQRNGAADRLDTISEPEESRRPCFARTVE